MATFGSSAHLAGFAVLALITVLMARSARRADLRYWALGWTGLAVASLAATLAGRLAGAGPLLVAAWALGETSFGAFALAACRSRSRPAGPRRALVVGLALIALGLGAVPWTFAARACVVAVLLAGFTLSGLAALRPLGRRPGSGLAPVRAVLLLLGIGYAQLAVALGAGLLGWLSVGDAYVRYAIHGLGILAALLGVAVLALAAEDERQQRERRDDELESARERLKLAARVDPLSDSVNRHAFYSVREIDCGYPLKVPDGCAALVEVESLETITERHGPEAGDAAVRAVARALRSVVRADDPIFRWGGDAFLVLLPGLVESEAHDRLGQLAGELREVTLPGVSRPTPVAVGFGTARFTAGRPLRQAVETAAAMLEDRRLLGIR